MRSAGGDHRRRPRGRDETRERAGHSGADRRLDARSRSSLERGQAASEQQRRVCGRPLRAEAVPADRAGAESGVRDRPVPDRARLHAHAGARRARSSICARVSSPARSPSCRRSSSIRAPDGSSRSTSCAATTSACRRGVKRNVWAGRAGGAGRTRKAPPPFFAALEHWYLQTAATLGRRTAELHVTLAEGTGPPFAPEPLDRTALGTRSPTRCARTATRRSTCSRSARAR